MTTYLTEPETGKKRKDALKEGQHMRPPNRDKTLFSSERNGIKRDKDTKRNMKYGHLGKGKMSEASRLATIISRGGGWKREHWK